jgi:hypothetical protein
MASTATRVLLCIFCMTLCTCTFCELRGTSVNVIRMMEHNGAYALKDYAMRENMCRE